MLNNERPSEHMARKDMKNVMRMNSGLELEAMFIALRNKMHLPFV